MTRLTKEQSDRISELHEQLQRKAGYVARVTYHGNADPDDLFQYAYLAICEKAIADPDFLNQSNSYVIQAGMWAAQDATRRVFRYEPDTILDDDDSGLSETLAAPETDLGLSIDVRRKLADLDETARTVAAMLVSGYQRKEIAAHLSVTSQSVGWQYTKIRRALAGVA